MAYIPNKLTPEDITTIESHFIIKIRELKKNEKITHTLMVSNLQALLDNQPVNEEFDKLKVYYKNPQLYPDEAVFSDSLLERQRKLRELLSKEIETLSKQQNLTLSLRRKSFSLGSSLSSVLTNSQKIVCWTYVEFEASSFIHALLDENEQLAYDCLFKQILPQDIRCFSACEDASSIMSSNEKYLTSLYQQCLIPLRIGFEITTYMVPEKNFKNVVLKQFNHTDLKILTCILGNRHFTEKHWIKTSDNTDIISGCNAKFIEKYQSLINTENEFVINNKIIKHPHKNGCSI